jgi:hypothetical protein
MSLHAAQKHAAGLTPNPPAEGGDVKTPRNKLKEAAPPALTGTHAQQHTHAVLLSCSRLVPCCQTALGQHATWMQLHTAHATHNPPHKAAKRVFLKSTVTLHWAQPSPTHRSAVAHNHYTLSACTGPVHTIRNRQHARAAVLSRPPEDKLACISLQQDTSKAAAQAAQPPSEHEGLQGRHHSRKASRAQLNNPKHQRSGLAFARALALAGALALALAVGAAGWVPAARLAAAACLALKWRAAELPWHKALAAHSTCEPCTDAHAGTKRSEMACKGVEQTLSLCAQAQQYFLQWHCNRLLAGWELCCRSVAVVLLPCAGDS